jgi:hypothetical protein
MTLTVLGAQLEQACGALHWIADGALCGGLRSTLERVAADLKRDDRQSVKDVLRTWLDKLEAQHGPGKPVNDNAYWLLKVNGEYLRAHL